MGLVFGLACHASGVFFLPCARPREIMHDRQPISHTAPHPPTIHTFTTGSEIAFLLDARGGLAKGRDRRLGLAPLQEHA